MKTLDSILTTHLFQLSLNGELVPIESQFYLSRQAMLQELKDTKKMLLEQELDLEDDYQMSIELLESTSDDQYEIWKNQLRRDGELS